MSAILLLQLLFNHCLYTMSFIFLFATYLESNNFSDIRIPKISREKSEKSRVSPSSAGKLKSLSAISFDSGKAFFYCAESFVELSSPAALSISVSVLLFVKVEEVFNARWFLRICEMSATDCSSN